MLRPRISPCLLIHKKGLVKTVGFKNPKYVGDPINAVKIFNEKEVDELIVLDIDATVNEHEPNYDLISKLANECRMPLCYGGGIKKPEQAKKIVSLGVEKVALSSVAIEDSNIISEISMEIGAQSTVVVLDVKKSFFGNSLSVYTRNGKINTKHDPFELVIKLEELGAGEIVINSIDLDGKMSGFNIQLAQNIKSIINIPITMLGGAGSLNDIEELMKKCGVIGIAAGSLFVFKGAYKAVLINYPTVLQRDEMIKRAFS